MLREPNVGRLSFRRMAALFIVIAVILGVFSVRLFQIQIVQGEEYAQLADESYKTSVSIAASRGEIVDCNQVPLVSNRTSYAVTLDYNYFPHGRSSEKLKEQNDCLLELVALLRREEEAWIDTLPITDEVPYAFVEDRESGIRRLKEMLRMASYATAQQCLDQIVKQYELDRYSPEEQRILAGIHYEMESAGFSAKVAYTFASDVSSTTMYRIMEYSTRFPGVDVITVPVREYVAGSTACHIIGTVGPIYAEEYAELKDKGYNYNDILGKSGIESAAEEYLRGTAGKRVLSKNSQGVVTSEEEVIAPVPGQTVVLCIDSQVQSAAQKALADKVADLRANGVEGKGKDVKSGAVVMLDVKTGGVIVCASWPDYDLSSYSENYNDLLVDADNPLFNRALGGAFPCGSTFKPGVALAAITDGIVKVAQYINCVYAYDYYAPSYVPKCMSRHGNLEVVHAIEKSCNYYFYDVGRLMGSSLFPYLELYGFGSKTGVEIGESSGIQQTPEYMRSIGGTWVGGDYLQLAIGQRGSYTPIQLAAYAMMIANEGVRYKTHLIKSVRSYDGSTETVIPTEVAAQVEWSAEAIAAVKEGMIAVGKTGTARASFANAPYTVACKTGTAQTGVKDASDHGTFIAYAPADNPEVALAVVMENGTSAASAAVARKVLDAYFEGKQAGEAPTPEGVLIP
ncbi:MAG: penicillin-binding protein [Clostridia bacterium]|nr:penicillin-binding protein [Clostridia bacterium]